MTQELEEPAHAVPDDGGAQVTHVHLFGDVGGGEIHHHLNGGPRLAPPPLPPDRPIARRRQTLFLLMSGGGETPLTSSLLRSLDTNVFFRWMLMKPEDVYNEQRGPRGRRGGTRPLPGPAISVFWTSSLSGRFLMIFSAISLGLALIPLAFSI